MKYGCWHGSRLGGRVRTRARGSSGNGWRGSTVIAAARPIFPPVDAQWEAIKGGGQPGAFTMYRNVREEFDI